MPFAIPENWQHRFPAPATANALILTGVAMVLMASGLFAAPEHRLSPPVLPEDVLRSRLAPQAGAPPASAPSASARPESAPSASPALPPSAQSSVPPKAGGLEGVTVVRDIRVKAEDGRSFLADFYRPKEGSGFRGVLVIPNGGNGRRYLEQIGLALATRGHAALLMDNTGQDRNLTHDADGRVMVRLLQTPMVDLLIRDVRAAGRVLLGQSGIAPGGVAIIGVGLGANLGLLYATETADVAAVALVLPGYGCDTFNPADLIGRLGTRPAFLVNTVKKKESDISRGFDAAAAKLGAPTREHLELPLSTRPVGEDEFSAHEGLSTTVLDWLERVLPPPVPR